MKGEHLTMHKKNVVADSDSATGPARPARSLSILAIFVLAVGALSSAQQSLPGVIPRGGAVIGGAPSGAGRGGGASIPRGGGGAGGSGSAAQGIASSMSVGSLTDAPIIPGETVHVLVFDAPDFSIIGQVSDGGDIAVPMAGTVHVAGLNSQTAGQAIAERLRSWIS